MTTDRASPAATEMAAVQSAEPPAKALTPEAQRALAEAEARRAARASADAAQGKPAEFGGQKGPDPVRYGDWEKGGIVSDF